MLARMNISSFEVSLAGRIVFFTFAVVIMFDDEVEKSNDDILFSTTSVVSAVSPNENELLEGVAAGVGILTIVANVPPISGAPPIGAVFVVSRPPNENELLDAVRGDGVDAPNMLKEGIPKPLSKILLLL